MRPIRLQTFGIQDSKLKTCLLLLLIVLAGGTMGYRILENWRWIDSIYMTVITISTVGFKEVRELSDAGRILTIVLIFAGVGTLGVTISILFEHFFQHQFKLITEKRSMQNRIDNLNKHTIVCGHGRMGKIIAEQLHRASKTIVVVETDAGKAEELERAGILVIKGDATAETTLQQAGVERAAALVATLGSDADNLFLTLTARDMNPKMEIIARAENEKNTRKFTQAGATRVVSPFAIGAGHIVSLLTRPTIVDFVDLITGEDDIKLEVVQHEVGPDSPFAGRTLAEGHVRQELGGMVIAIRKTDKNLIFDPTPSTRIDGGDRLFVMSSSPS
jgi:voltage-gated potassium channel